MDLEMEVRSPDARKEDEGEEEEEEGEEEDGGRGEASEESDEGVGEEGEGESPARASAPYWSFLLLLGRSLFASLDHLSDALVLADLWQRGRRDLFAVGLALDLLPGPASAAHFLRLGYPWWRCAALLFHPANFYVHTALAHFGSSSSSSFSRQVADHSREAQALLEAPMQLIFTLTLICLRQDALFKKQVVVPMVELTKILLLFLLPLLLLHCMLPLLLVFLLFLLLLCCPYSWFAS